jgi:hypothetical protein
MLRSIGILLSGRALVFCNVGQGVQDFVGTLLCSFLGSSRQISLITFIDYGRRFAF